MGGWIGGGRRLSLRALLSAIALLAAALAVAMPAIKRAIGPNSWVVRTVRRPDGTVVRQRIRRHPDRDVLFEEVLAPPPR